jgi:antitoxin MazE
MRVQVAKWGNSTAVRLPKAVLKELGVEPGQEMELIVEGREARLKPVTSTIPSIDLEDLLAECDRIGWVNRPSYEDWGILPSEWPEEDWSDIAPKDDEGELLTPHRKTG